MKFSYSSNGFRLCSLLDAIRIISETGYEGIEIMADVPHAYPLHLSERDVSAIRTALGRNRLEVSNINAFMHHANGDTYHPSWIEQDPAMRTERLEFTLHCIDLAERLGAKTLSTEPGGPLEGMERREGLALFTEGLRALEARAQKRGIRILIEPEPGLLIENSSQFLDLFEELNPEVFGLNFDIGHFFCVGEDPALLVEKLKSVAHHFHLEDIAASREHFHLLPGKGAIDLHHVLNTIQGIGHTGFVTVELYTYEDQAEKAAREALAYLQDWRKTQK